LMAEREHPARARGFPVNPEHGAWRAVRAFRIFRGERCELFNRSTWFEPGRSWSLIKCPLQLEK